MAPLVSAERCAWNEGLEVNHGCGTVESVLSLQKVGIKRLFETRGYEGVPHG